MKKNKLIVLIASILVLSGVGYYNANAYFDGGSGSSSGTAGSCASRYEGTGWCESVRAWYFYQYKENVDYDQVKVRGYQGYYWSNGQKVLGDFKNLSLIREVSIPSAAPYECDDTSSGFYLSGIVLYKFNTANPEWHFNDNIWAGQNLGNGSYRDYLYDLGNNTGIVGWDGQFLGLITYNSGATYYNGGRFPLSNVVPPKADNGSFIDKVWVVPKSEVESVWNSTAKKLAGDAGKSTNLSNYSWFCAGDKVKKEGQNYKGSATIKINAGSSDDFNAHTDVSYTYSDSGNGGTGTKDGVYTITSGSGNTTKITARSYGRVEANGVPSGYEEGHRNTSFTISMTSKSGNGSETTIVEPVSPNGSTTDSPDAPGGKAQDYELQNGVEYTICAVNTYRSTYRSDGGGFGNPKTVKACAKVKYNSVTAEIDSDSLATLDSTYYTSGTDDQKTYDVEVDAGPKQISWAHYMGYKNRSDGKDERVTVNVRGVKGGCGNETNSIVVDSYMTPSVPNGYNLSRLRNTSCSEGTPIINSAPVNISRENKSKTGAFPGETREEYQKIEHPSKVYVSDGTPAEGSVDERSQVTLRLHANDLQCGLRTGDLGVTRDYLYNIGVDNPYDYRWLAVYRTGGSGFPAARALVGDDMRSYETLWLSPKDRIMISQTACFGSQIAIDSQNSAEDKWSSNPWSNLSDSSNSKFNLDTAQEIKNTGLFGDNYLTASGLRSTDGPSFRASEIGGETEFKNPNSGAVSTPQNRINDGYKIETTTNERQIGAGNVGESMNTTFSKPNGDGATVNIKVPYNYDLELSLGSGNNILNGGEITKFTAQIKNKKRVNMQVCNGISSNSNTVCSDYSTGTKPTYYGMLVFAMDSNFKYSDLENHTDFTSNGNAFEGTGDVETLIKNKVESELGKSISSVVSYTEGAGTGDSIPTGNVRKIESNEIDYGDYPVGTKICAAIVAYPSDSHNMPGVNVIDDEYQWAAFDESGSLTKYVVTCRTVAKYQTMSVEGNGAVALSNISTSDVIYKNRVFKSWSEYQIIAGSSNASSGAVTAYGLGHPASSVNQKHSGFDVNPDLYSIENDSSLSHYPQSLGNYSLFWGNPAASDEATVNYGYAKALRKNIIDTYGGGDSCNTGEISGKKAYLICTSGDLNSTYVPGVDTIVVRSNSNLTLTDNSHLAANERSLWGDKVKQIIIIANNIFINGDVENIKAWLIVSGDYGTLNTCAGHKLIGGETGHEDLFRDCYAPLVIDGPVISGSGLELLRTYGGGSKKVDDDIVADPDSFAQRAEIFNYDPGVVRWAYEESLKNPQVVTTYTEDLAPRL